MAAQVLERYDERQVDTQTALHTLEDLVRDYNEAKAQEAAKEFKGKNTFAVYWLLHREGVADDSLAAKVERIIAAHPHSRVNPENARQLRLTLTAELMKPFGREKVADVIDKLLALERQEA